MELETIEGEVRCFVRNSFGTGIVGIEVGCDSLHSQQNMLALVSLKDIKAAIECKESFDSE